MWNKTLVSETGDITARYTCEKESTAPFHSPEDRTARFTRRETVRLASLAGSYHCSPHSQKGEYCSRTAHFVRENNARCTRRRYYCSLRSRENCSLHSRKRAYWSLRSQEDNHLRSAQGALTRCARRFTRGHSQL